MSFAPSPHRRKYGTKIIEYRNKKVSLKDFGYNECWGIGDKKFEKIKEYLVID